MLYYPPTHHLGVLVQTIEHDNIEKLIMEYRKDLLKDSEDFEENKECWVISTGNICCYPPLDRLPDFLSVYNLINKQI